MFGPPAADEVLTVAGLRKAFGAQVALDGVDLTVARGEVVALLGPNGAGKSTLLRILATTVRPDAGSASVDGHDIRDDPLGVRRSLGIVFGEERGWYWRLDGRRNLDFFGRLRGLSLDELRPRAERLLAQFDLTEHARKPVGALSSGLRARLGLVRALLGDPAALLLDEPSGHLDPVAANDLRGRLEGLARGGTGILLATHDLWEAAAIATRSVGLSGGRVAFVQEGGTAGDLERRLISA